MLCAQARCDNKQGLLAPGMAEAIGVEFCPQQFCYYTDTIRLESSQVWHPYLIAL